jgi:hypothetical protein
VGPSTQSILFDGSATPIIKSSSGYGSVTWGVRPFSAPPNNIECTFGFGCDEDGDDASLTVVVKRVKGAASPGDMLSCMEVERLVGDPFQQTSMLATSFWYEVAVLDAQGSQLHKIAVPSVPAFDYAGDGTIYAGEFFQVSCKDVGNGKALLAFYVMQSHDPFGISFATNLGLGYYQENPVEKTNWLNVPNIAPLPFVAPGVRHLFEECPFSDGGYSVVSPGGEAAGFHFLYRVTDEVESALPADHADTCSLALPPIYTENDDESLDDVPQIQITPCEYRLPRGHVTHAVEGQSFTGLQLGFMLDFPSDNPDQFQSKTYELTNVWEDGTQLASGVFWYSDNPGTAFQAITNQGTTIGTLRRAEIAATIHAAPGRPCVTPRQKGGFGEFSETQPGQRGEWSVAVHVAMRLEVSLSSQVESWFGKGHIMLYNWEEEAFAWDVYKKWSARGMKLLSGDEVLVPFSNLFYTTIKNRFAGGIVYQRNLTGVSGLKLRLV